MADQHQDGFSPQTDSQLSKTVINSTDITKREVAVPQPKFPVADWDRYEFIELLGEGGMGRVYKACDLRLKRTVALKFLRTGVPELLERFLREARVQARIEHERICKVYEVGEIEGQNYIAMQYIEGQSLKLFKDKLSLNQKVKIVKDIAEALHAAHKIGLIHRDIKPDNIILEQVGDEWRPYLMDFGLARIVETAGITVTGAIMGTPAYISPEQAQGEVSSIDCRTDIYSLGATCYELLVGHPPFGNNTGMEVIVKLMHTEPDSLRRVNGDIPVDLETIVMKCLEKEPQRRYRSAKELAEDLERFLNGDPIAAQPTTFIYKVQKKARKNRALVSVTAISLTAMLLLGAMAGYARWAAAEQARLAQQFGQEVKEIEALMRYAYLLPLHDTKNEKEIIRRRMQSIKVQMEQIGRAAIGPGSYALGRGYLALNEYEAAREYLEKALVAGYQSPEVKYALGQALGALYQKHLEEVERISNKELREARRQQIEQDFRNPALEHLKASKGLQLESPEYVEGLIAFYEKRYDEALQKIQQASQLLWFYEAKRLVGDIYFTLGSGKQNNGNYEGAMEDYQRAGEVYQATIEIAHSDSTVYEQECGRCVKVMELKLVQGDSPHQAFEQALSSCNNALTANSENVQAYIKKSWAYWRLGEYKAKKGEDPRPLLEQSVEMAQTAIHYNPGIVAAYHSAGTSFIIKSQFEQARGIDPRLSLEHAIEYYQKAIQVNPNYVSTYSNLGIVYDTKGQYESELGLDPRPSFERAADYLQQAIKINPDFANAYTSLGIVYFNTGKYEAEQGLDPRPALASAAEYLQQAVKINPNLANAYNTLGNVYTSRGQYEQVQGLNPMPALERAVEYFHKAIQVNPNYALAYSNLASAYQIKGEYEYTQGVDPQLSLERAINNLQKSIQINPNYAYGYNSLASIYYLKGYYQHGRGLNPLESLMQSIEYCHKAIEKKPNYAAAFSNLGMAYIAIGEHRVRQGLDPSPLLERARVELERAVQLNNKNAGIYQRIATLYHRCAEWRLKNNRPLKDEINNGKRAVEKAHAINPHLADVIALQGAFYLLEARIIQESNNKQSLLQQAVASLEKALKMNALLQREYAPLLAQARQLAQ